MLEEKLTDGLGDAMRAGDTTRRDTIRQLRSALHNDSISEFKRGNREDLVAKEEAELKILAGYLPEQMSRDAISASARAAIQKVGATGKGDQGKVMRELSGELRGKAD